MEINVSLCISSGINFTSTKIIITVRFITSETLDFALSLVPVILKSNLNFISRLQFHMNSKVSKDFLTLSIILKKKRKKLIISNHERSFSNKFQLGPFWLGSLISGN